jgi:hypothetical protein
VDSVLSHAVARSGNFFLVSVRPRHISRWGTAKSFEFEHSLELIYGLCYADKRVSGAVGQLHWNQQFEKYMPVVAETVAA